VDAFEDATGVDASASTNEIRSASYYSGGSGTISTSKTFAYTGANESWTIPGSTTTITVKAWGAGGGGGGHTSCGGGGGAGYATAVFAVTGGPTLIGVLGGGGKYGSKAPNLAGPGTGAFGGGGDSYNNEENYTDANGGGGGGYSGLFVGSVSQANAIIIAGGAGGGGYNSSNGGYGGGTSGGDGEDGGNINGRGLGGTSSAGGAAGAIGDVALATAGSALQGGTGSKTSQPYYGATGGGGWYGGGGAGSSGGQGASGSGGGSGYIRSADFPTGVTSSSSTTLTNGSIGSGTSGGAEANSGDSDSSGAGGNQQVSGENGALKISYSYSPVANMTLVSNAITAQAQPTKADVVLTYTNGAGTATINTDLIASVSRDNGTTYTAVTLASQGTTGGHTILTANDVDVSGQPAGTSMRWKVATANQSASKDTRIHAVSLGWS
jgi:hypothetical protein